MGIKSSTGLFVAVVLVALVSLTQFLVINQRLENMREDYQTTYDSLNSQIQELQSIVEAQEATIETLSKQVAELQETIDELTRQLSLLDFTEADPNYKLRVSKNRVEFDSINRMEKNTALYKEYPVGFTSFNASFTAFFSRVDPSIDLFNRLNLFTAANYVHDYIAQRDSGKPQLCVRVRSNDMDEGFRVELMETEALDTNPVRGNASYALNISYYFHLARSRDEAVLSIYEDTSHRVLVERLTLLLNYTGAYKFILFPQSCGYYAGHYSSSGFLDSLRFTPLDEPFNPFEPFLYVPSEVYRNDFEGYEIGSIPEGWNRTGGAIHDHASIQGNTSVSGSQSLWFNETGGDDERIELRTHNISGLSSVEIRYSFKISRQRAVIQVANETGETIFMVNCKVGDTWGYWVNKGQWHPTPNSPVPEPDTWYDVTILVDTERQLLRVYIDGFDSGWIRPEKGWEHISYITFRGNNNFPGEFWVDDFKLSEFK